MLRNPIAWFEIYASDIERAKTFYESVFQVKLENMGEGFTDVEIWAFPGSPDAGGASDAICTMKGMEPGNNSTLVYFSCEDCSIEEQRVKDFAGRVHQTKEAIGQHGFCSIVYDTEGNMFGLHSLK